jgi:hypothetical protein
MNYTNNLRRLGFTDRSSLSLSLDRDTRPGRAAWHVAERQTDSR